MGRSRGQECVRCAQKQQASKFALPVREPKTSMANRNERGFVAKESVT